METIKVNCDFCSKEIECPENMMKSERHACFECFNKMKDKWSGDDFEKVHVDIPMDKMDEIMPEMLMNSVLNEVFPQLWKEKKSDLKQLSKKEIAEEMFAAGAESMIDVLKEMDKISGEEINKMQNPGIEPQDG